VLPLAISTGHEIGLAVVAACFIAFALASSFLFPRFRAQFPGRGLPAFIVVAVVFFVGMLAAVVVFGAEPKETKKSERAAQTFSQAQQTTSGTSTTNTQPTTTPKPTTSTKPKTVPLRPVPAPEIVQVTETEFKITLSPKTLQARTVTFAIKNVGKLPHDLAIVGGPKSPLIAPGKSTTLTTKLKKGKIELYCSVPGHKQAGMDVKTTVS
jgi:uncharacterized cupredoxin-like copper-binding protein